MGRSAPATFASVVAIAALALIGKPSAAGAQGFPSKPVRIIVPYTPGSPNDVMVRLLAQQLQGRLGQAVVIDNKLAPRRPRSRRPMVTRCCSQRPDRQLPTS